MSLTTSRPTDKATDVSASLFCTHTIVIFGEKYDMLRIYLLSDRVAIFVQIQLRSSYIRRLPSNTATE